MNEKTRLPRWIVIWLLISMLIVFWDVTFVLFRPASFAEGALGLIYIPYAKYIKIDTSYADMNNAFVVAQSIMSLFEIALGLIALYLNYRRVFLAACLFAFSSQLLTATKTILIFLLEIVGGMQHVGHNVISDLILYYFMPNSVWIVLPFAVVIVLGRLLIIC